MPRIRSWEQLQRSAGRILEVLNGDQDLARAAAANPELALAEAGFPLDPEARTAIVDRLRLGGDGATELATLRDEIARLAGRPVDPGDSADVRRLLTDLAEEAGERSARSDVDLEPPRYRPGGPTPDGLEAFGGLHPVVDVMVRYRRLNASAPEFAPEAVFRAVRHGEKEAPIGRATGVLQKRSAVTGRRGRRSTESQG